MTATREPERIDTVVVGGGQAGLSAGYHLARRNVPFVILEANGRIGDSWRARWDSLRLFTPARFDGLDGMRFPVSRQYFPTKDEMADYLEAYANRFQLPVRTGVRVDRVSRQGDGFLIEAGDDRIEARNVVVAMANFQRPHVPSFAADLRPDIVQIHSSEYRNPGQLRDGEVLVVGAGNSGAEIALEVARTHRVVLAGRDVGHVPFRIEGRLARFLAWPVFRGLFHRVLSVSTPIGRRVRAKVLTIGGPLIRVKPSDLEKAGVRVIRAKVVGAREGLPVLADGVALNVANVIWCTRFRPGFDWIDIPVHGDFEPIHERGVVPGVPGLYFVGLHFLSAMSSVMIHGVGRDAERIAAAVAQRRGSEPGEVRPTANDMAHAEPQRRVETPVSRAGEGVKV